MSTEELGVDKADIEKQTNAGPRRAVRVRAALMLFFAAVIWGTAFVAQDSAGSKLENSVFTITFSRFLIGAAVLMPFWLVYRKRANGAKTRADVKKTFLYGTLCGAALFIPCALQQLGINSGASSAKAGFITVMYVVLVPICGIFMKKKLSPLCWIAVVLAPIGLYLLCITPGSFKPEPADLYLIGCAVGYTVQILLIDRFAPKCDALLMTIAQFFCVGVLAFICAVVFERGSIAGLGSIVKEILFLGVLSCGVGYTFQVLGQKNTDPTVASLLMSLESVFALIAGVVILGQKPTGRELSGCALIFAAVILAQVPTPHRKNSKGDK